ncbi:MAG: hypothetical protein ACI841_000174 [Planctomycetota bacterium]|jgi:hypothetical protein
MLSGVIIRNGPTACGELASTSAREPEKILKKCLILRDGCPETPLTARRAVDCAADRTLCILGPSRHS